MCFIYKVLCCYNDVVLLRVVMQLYGYFGVQRGFLMLCARIVWGIEKIKKQISLGCYGENTTVLKAEHSHSKTDASKNKLIISKATTFCFDFGGTFLRQLIWRAHSILGFSEDSK